MVKQRTNRRRKLNGQERTITVSPAGQQVDISKRPATGGYKPLPHLWFQTPVDLPLFDYRTIRAMLMDEGIRLNFETRAAPIYGLQFGWEENGVWQEGVKCRDPGVAQFIYRQLQRIWKTYLPEILRAQIWGWSAGEVKVKYSDETGLIEIDRLLSRHPMDCELLKLDGCERWGVRIKRVTEGTVDLPFPYAWFHAHAAEDGEDYGISAAYGAYSAWADKWFDGGAKQVRRLFMHKDAYGGADLSYPDGETWIAGYDRPVPNRDIAREIVEQLRAGSVTVRPNQRDENGNERWELTRATVASNPQHILQYPKDLDDEIRHGMGICDDVINGDSTGAWAGKKIPMQSFYATLDAWVTTILRDLCEQIIDHLLKWNFGKVIEYETPFKPLAKQAMEQQGQGQQQTGMPQDAPGQQPGQDGPQTGIPGANDEPQQQPQMANMQPVGMSLVASGELTPFDMVARAREIAIMRMSVDGDDSDFELTPQRIEAIAELLAAIYGDHAQEALDKILPDDKPIKLAVWNPSDHPRGPDGRFIQKGTEEAYSLAKQKVDDAHRSRSADSMSDLMGHLNTLTTKQLHGLKKDYGVKASAKTKAALVAKLTERLTSGKHRTAERENGTPVAPVRENVYTVPTDALQVDPTRFQYKVKGIGAKGVGEELKGTKTWNPELGGVILVWRDPADGNDYVVNGHHRHELASRAGADVMNVRYIDANSAKVARSIGALANIAEGRGSAIDAAKYLRDSGQTVEHFKAAGISMSGKVASDAAALVDLSDKAFAAVAQGKMDEDNAVAVARHLKEHDLQDQLFKKIWQREDDGKDWTPREIETAAKKMARAGKVTESGTDLFGDWQTEESTFDQEVELETYINKALATEANDFAAVSSTRRAERVAETGNILATDKNAERRDAARSALQDFEREAALKGPIAEAIKAQAARLAKATKKTDREAVKKAALEDVRKVLAAMQAPVEDKPAIVYDTRTNESAKAGDQLGMFGEVANVPKPKATLGNGADTRGVPVGLFETSGDPDQILLFDDGVATPDRTWRPAIAMSLTKHTKRYRGIDMPSMWTLTEEEAKQVEAGARTLLRLNETDQDTIMMSLARLQEENRVLRMSVDVKGHEHAGKGPGGGRFVSKGKGSDSGGSGDTESQKSPKSPANKPMPKNDSPEGESRSKMSPQATAPAKPPKNDAPKTDIDEEPITPPPPGKAFQVNVEETGPDGVALTARVGIPGRVVAPPPPIPKLPNLTKHERQVEGAFMDAFMRDPDGMAQKYRELIGKTSKPYTFETDQAKCLSDDWNDPDLDTQMRKRQLHNNALHQTANAIVKRAFLQHLNTLKPGDSVLVTVGGCGSGKGYTLKNTELGKNLTAEAKAVWDSAGDQNATENPWILEEATKRGLKVTYAYVAGDPKVSWAHPERGVVKRAHDNSDGRMVDAAVFADSYVLGAKNHHAFHQANKDNPNAKFLFFSAKDQSELPGVPEESLNMDRKALYHWAMGSIQSRTDVAPSVMRGATAGARIWNEEFGG